VWPLRSASARSGWLVIFLSVQGLPSCQPRLCLLRRAEFVRQLTHCVFRVLPGTGDPTVDVTLKPLPFPKLTLQKFMTRNPELCGPHQTCPHCVYQTHGGNDRVSAILVRCGSTH
jgi:hypothetical protein